MKGEFAMFTQDPGAGPRARRCAGPGFTLLVLFAMWLLLTLLGFRAHGLLYPGLLLLLALPVLFVCVFRPGRRGGTDDVRAGTRIAARDAARAGDAPSAVADKGPQGRKARAGSGAVRGRGASLRPGLA